MKTIRILLAFVLSLLVAQADAAVRASLDHDHVALGEGVTLTIESDGSAGKPDLSSLRKDFDVRGIATGSQTTIVNGNMQSTLQWSVSLVPRHSGVIDIPAIAVGGDRTAPLRLGVDPASSSTADQQTSGPAAAHPGGRGDPVFIESSIAPEHPYVQEATIYTVRLYYAVAPLDASLDVPNPDNGDLRQIGTDERDSVMVQGHRYDVLQRHYLLQPERSGTLHIPAPVFQGRAMPDLNSMFEDGQSGGDLRTVGKPLDVAVRARPAQAGDPWLPARSLQLSVDPANTPLRAGEPFSLVVHLAGDGVTAAQLPEIALPGIAGAQIYPEPSSIIEHAHDGSLQAERTRRFAIVPDRAGTLRLPELTVPWWDVVNDRAALARIAMPAVDVLPGSGSHGGQAGDASMPVLQPSGALAVSSASALRGWQIATLTLGVLLGLSLWWGWRRGRFKMEMESDADAEDAVDRALPRGPTLARALAFGDPAVITQSLLDAAPGTPPRGLGEVAQRLEDPAQRAAVMAFDAARWSANGTPTSQSLSQLRTAFGKPPRWTSAARKGRHDDALPPLYPS